MPLVGQMIGGMALGHGGPIASAAGGVAGAATGEAGRVGIGKMLGVNDRSGREQVLDSMKNAAFGEMIGGVPNALGMIPPVKNMAKRGAIRIMQSYLRPSKKLAKAAPDVAEDALKLGVKGNKKEALDRLYHSLGAEGDKLNAIIKNAPNEEIGIENAFKYVDELIEQAEFAQAYGTAKTLKKQKANLMKIYNADEPIYGVSQSRSEKSL